MSTRSTAPHDDLFVGASSDTTGGTGAGAVFLFYGGEM